MLPKTQYLAAREMCVERNLCSFYCKNTWERGGRSFWDRKTRLSLWKGVDDSRIAPTHELVVGAGHVHEKSCSVANHSRAWPTPTNKATRVPKSSETASILAAKFAHLHNAQYQQ